MKDLTKLKDELLSVKESRRALNVGQTKFYVLLNSKQLKAYKVGSRTFCKRSDIEAYINSLPAYNSTVGGDQ